MLKKFLVIIGLVLIAPLYIFAAPQYHDYSQYYHWESGFFTQDDDITSVSLCQIQGATYWVTTGMVSGLCFYEINDGGLDLISSLPLPGVEQGVVFGENEAYVIARPNRLTKIFVYSVSNPISLWTDVLPGNPWDIKKFGEYLLLACGEDGLLVYDPTLNFNIPIGVVATWPGEVQEISIQGNVLVVLTSQGLKTLDFSDPLNPQEIGSIEIGPTLAMAVVDDLAYISVGDEVTEIDFSDPASLISLRVMSHPYHNFSVTAIYPTLGGLHLSSGAKLHFLDLQVGEITWSGQSINGGQEMAQFGDYLGLAAADNGFHVFAHGAPVYAPSSEPFDPVGNLKDMQIVGDLLFGYFGGRVDCYDLALNEPYLAWTHESELNNEYLDALVVQGDRIFMGYNNGRVRILEYDLQSWTELAYFQSAGEEIVDLAPLPGHLAVFADPTNDVYREGVLEIYDLANISNPSLVSSQVQNDYPRMSFSGTTLILWDHTSSNNGALLIDATDPQNPVMASTIATPYYSELTVNNNYLYLVEPPILQAVDISDPYYAQFGPEIFIPQGWYLETHGKYGYLLYTDLVFDLNDPMMPVPVGSTNNQWTGFVHYCAAGAGYLVVGSSGYLTLMAEHSSVLSPAPEVLPDHALSGLTAFPNPFNPKVHLKFNMPSPGLAEIGIFDVKGRKVAGLEVFVAASGPAQVQWDGQDDSGRNMPSGIYLVQVLTSQGQEVGKVVLAR